MSVGKYRSSTTSKEKYKEIWKIMVSVCSVKEHNGLVPKSKTSFSNWSLSNHLQEPPGLRNDGLGCC